MYTQPQLEIYADDVKCSHGATVGQLDENRLLSFEYHTCCLGINIFSLAYRTALAFIQFTTETFLNQEM